MKTIHNELLRTKTSLLVSIIKAYKADYGRLLTIEETVERNRAISLFQSEIDSREKKRNLNFL